jgi:hypothetical protein
MTGKLAMNVSPVSPATIETGAERQVIGRKSEKPNKERCFDH